MKKFNIKKNMTASLDLPSEYAINATKLSLWDFSKLEVINYKSIIEYSENIIRINTKEKIIKIEGENLNIDNITDEEIGISGQIISFNFE